MSSRNKRDRERDKRGTGDAKSDGSKEDGPTLSNGISADSPPRNASSKETSTSVGAGGKDDSDEKSNEANRDDVADIIRNSTDPKMATLRAEYEALLQGESVAATVCADQCMVHSFAHVCREHHTSHGSHRSR